MYNTELAIKGMGIRLPPSPPSPEDTHCAFCRREIRAGDPHEPLKTSDGFMDNAWTGNSGVLCQYCHTMAPLAHVLANFNSILYTPDGAYPISKDEHRAWFLLNPPEPPFVATTSDSMNSLHVVWKAPVTLSTDMMYVATPTRILSIRRKILMQAISVCETAMAEFNRLREEEQLAKLAGTNKKPRPSTGKTVFHPFATLDRNLRKLDHGMIRADIRSFAGKSEKLAEALEFLSNLSLGETWALATLLKQGTVTPVKPEPLNPYQKQADKAQRKAEKQALKKQQQGEKKP